MKNIIALLLTLLSLSMPTYAGGFVAPSPAESAHSDFNFDFYQVQKSLDQKKGKFSDAEFAKLSAELKDAKAIMMNKRGIDLHQYYKVRDEQEARILKVKAEVDAKQ